ncbi:MAG: MerR family transcriptional regulator, partial [Deltaproteobacteria bacterium]|nr:MerR family transcriptional regulator [Deltaproteobacteria bacterium]
MNREKASVKPLRRDLPVYPVGVAARLIGVHPRTLRFYRAEGLIRTEQAGARLLFSQNDIRWAGCLRSMIHDKKLSMPGIKKLLQLVPCWEASDCPQQIHCSCPAQVDWAVPRTLRLVGDR